MISEHLLGWLTLLIVILIITLIAKKHPKTSNFIFVLLLRSIFVIFDEYFLSTRKQMDAWTFEQFAFRYSENYGLDIIPQFSVDRSFFQKLYLYFIHF